MYLPVLLGTAREGRLSDKAASYVASFIHARGLETQVIDSRAVSPSVSHEKLQADDWKSIAERADGFIIVTPEYNHGYPGILKDILDSATKEYARKPIAICGCSAGGLGGARVVEQLREVAVELRLVPIREAVYFSNHLQLWNEDGSIKDQAYEKRVQTMLDELVWYAEVLKEGREKHAFPEPRT